MKTTEEYKEEYLLKMPIYEKLGDNLCESIELILQAAKIDNLKVYYRIKDVDSFIEKIERKNYTKPFEQTEDICGIRIICYFQKDVEIINGILKKEIDVKESQDKEDLLEINQFGYRSYHLIASIPTSWQKTPNFRNLKGLKAEIQIRTVLMHAWAEIEHKLSYKKKSHIPDQIKRKLFRLSAKLEEADEQFQEIKEQSDKIQLEILQKAIRKDFNFSDIKNLDLDTLQAYLDFKFPGRSRGLSLTSRLLDDLNSYKLTLQDIEDGYEKVKPYLKEIEESVFLDKEGKWAQVGAARYILDLTNDIFLERHSKNTDIKEKKSL